MAKISVFTTLKNEHATDFVTSSSLIGEQDFVVPFRQHLSVCCLLPLQQTGEGLSYHQGYGLPFSSVMVFLYSIGTIQVQH